MQNKVLHIISFDNPFLPKYGGVIEVFYKIKALSEKGCHIYLHCFVDDIQIQESILYQYVKEVHFYKNKKSFIRFFSLIPFSVSYRNSRLLLSNLNKVEAPVIFEGLKTTSLIRNSSFSQKTILRLHNIEHQYFFGLARSEWNIFMKILFYIEGFKYRLYEPIIQKFDAISTLSQNETDYISRKFKKSFYIPLFHGNEIINELLPFGDYAIYNGDLRTADNRKAVLFLIDIFKKVDYNLVIAASEGEEWVEKRIKSFENINFIRIVDFDHLKQLLSKAHINVMTSFQESGTKIKVINALYNSRHCLINKNMIDDQRILDLCKISCTKEGFIEQIEILRKQPFIDFEKRKAILNEILNDKKNADALMKIINSTTKHEIE